MVPPDPDAKYEEVRAEHGEAAAANAVIRLSKMVATVAIVSALIFTGGFFIMGGYVSSKVSTCRDIVEDRFFATIGVGLLELRDTGELSTATAINLQNQTDAIQNITRECPDAFWPWDIPTGEQDVNRPVTLETPDRPVPSTTEPDG